MLRYVLAAVSGALYFLGFAGFGIWPFAFVALIPMLWVLDPDLQTAQLKTRQVLGIGFVAGLVMNYGGYYWIADTLKAFSGFALVWCVLLTTIVCAYQALGLTLFAWIYRKARAWGANNLLAATCAMCFSEWFFPELFKHYYGASLHNVPLAIQVADLGGALLLSGLLTVANVGLYTLALNLRTHIVDRRTVSIAAAVWAATLLYGAYRIHEVDARSASAPKITVGMVQTNMGLTQKREDPREGLRRHIEQTVDLQKEHKIDLLVWPESAFGWFLPERIKNVTNVVFHDQVHTPTIFGGLSQRERDDKEEAFNTAFMTDADGTIVGTYDKTYLLAFGEYLPFGDVFPKLYELSPNSGRFTPGSHVQPLPFGKYRIGMLICYEDILPSFVSQTVSAGNPHLLVSIANDAWFGDSHAPWEHMALANLRAVEHHRALVRSTNSGVSCVVDPVGRMLATSGTFTRENLSAEVPMLEGSTVYLLLGDFPGYVSLIVLAGLAIQAYRKRRRAPAPAA
ncbi:MAG: Apolipoprotein N-acyltransferase [Myxococcaceae bacterium]|nr:Apolipoprotein N-acyltransferase [Myxococcaceae bacterium]